MRLTSIPLALLLLFAGSSDASTITVTTLADADPQDNGACSLREALTAAAQNQPVDSCIAGDDGSDLIRFDPSLIPADPDQFRIDLTTTLQPSGGDLVIEGPEAARLIISGDEQFQVLRASMLPTASLTLRRLQLADGMASGEGGALRINAGLSLLMLDDVEMLNNHSAQAGGALSLVSTLSTSVLIRDSLMMGNTAPRGGAISLTTTGSNGPTLDVTIERSELITNEATGNSGGALYVLPFDADSLIELTVLDSLFDRNTAVDTGGAISAAGQPSSNSVRIDLRRNLFVQNISTNASGGAYRSVNLDSSLINNSFIGNQSEFSGGAINQVNTSGDRLTRLIANTFHQNLGGAGAPTPVAREASVNFTSSTGSINEMRANVFSADTAPSDDPACFFGNTGTLTDSGRNVTNDADCIVLGNDLLASDLRLIAVQDASSMFPLWMMPQPASPVIDVWPESECQAEGTDLELDMVGRRRDALSNAPHDGDADANFDCDAGAIEAPSAQRLDLSTSGSGRLFELTTELGCTGNCTFPIPTGQMVRLLAQPGVDHQLGQWTGACAGTPTDQRCELTVNSQTVAGVIFSPGNETSPLQVLVSGDGQVVSDPMGIDCEPFCTNQFVQGSTVELTPLAPTGTIFDQWTGACTGSADCSVLIDGSGTQSVTAQFINQDYNLTVTTTGSGVGQVMSLPGGIDCTPLCSSDFPAGTTVSLQASATGDDQFVGFSGDCSGLACTLEMTADMNVTAEFETVRTLDVLITGNGQVTSTPAAIDCPGTCSVTASQFSSYTLQATETVAGELFLGWQGCTPIGDGTQCAVQLLIDTQVRASFGSDALFADGFED